MAKISTPLPGFRLFEPKSCALRNHVFSQWRQCAKTFGFEEYDLPILEPLELFTEKSGEEIKEQLFSFEDKGGRHVALRPEMTPGIAHYVGHKAASFPKPLKWFSIGEQFRYERPQKGRLRSFYQFNADIFGEPGPGADAEIIALAIAAFERFGIARNQFCIRLSDRTLWFAWGEALGLNEADFTKVLAVVDKKERTPADKLETLMAAALAGTPAEGTRTPATLLAQVETLTNIRTLEGLETFFNNTENSQACLQRLQTWRTLLETLSAFGVEDSIRIDLGIVRGLAYYTGFVFEAFQTVGKARALCGGGRYDSLCEKMGGGPLPAVGFGIGDVTLQDLMQELNLTPNFINAPHLYVAYTEDTGAHTAALRAVSLARAAGLRPAYSMKPLALGKQLKAAVNAGAQYCLLYGEDELAAKTVCVKNLNERTEEHIPTQALPEFLRALA